MTTSQVLIANSVRLLLLLTVAGILVRRRANLCWTFTTYLMVILLCNLLQGLWPATFFTTWFWILKQGLYDALKMGIAAELAFRVFQAFAGAQANARRVIFASLGVTALFLVGVPHIAGPGSPSAYGAAMMEWEPRVLTGTIWLLNGLALLVIWYRVPVH